MRFIYSAVTLTSLTLVICTQDVHASELNFTSILSAVLSKAAGSTTLDSNECNMACPFFSGRPVTEQDISNMFYSLDNPSGTANPSQQEVENCSQIYVLFLGFMGTPGVPVSYGFVTHALALNACATVLSFGNNRNFQDYFFIYCRRQSFADVFFSVLKKFYIIGSLNKTTFTGHSLGGQVMGLLLRIINKEYGLVSNSLCMECAKMCYYTGNMQTPGIGYDPDVSDCTKSLHTTNNPGTPFLIAKEDTYSMASAEAACKEYATSSNGLSQQLAVQRCQHLVVYCYLFNVWKNSTMYPRAACNSRTEAMTAGNCTYNSSQISYFMGPNTNCGPPRIGQVTASPDDFKKCIQDYINNSTNTNAGALS